MYFSALGTLYVFLSSSKHTRPLTHINQIALIVNDMGAINLDAEEIKNAKLVQQSGEMVELHNGCICCTLRGDLLTTVKVGAYVHAPLRPCLSQIILKITPLILMARHDRPNAGSGRV